MSIRWNLIHELNCMEAVPDERTELAQLRKLKAGIFGKTPVLFTGFFQISFQIDLHQLRK